MARELIKLSPQLDQDEDLWRKLYQLENLGALLIDQYDRQQYANFLLWRENKRLQGEIVGLNDQVSRLRPPPVVGIPNSFADTDFMGFPCSSCGLMVWTTAEEGSWRSSCPKCKTPCVHPIEPPNV